MAALICTQVGVRHIWSYDMKVCQLLVISGGKSLPTLRLGGSLGGSGGEEVGLVGELLTVVVWNCVVVWKSV
jgi:hypothetical protein